MIANQPVHRMEYDTLKGVAVTFIMSEDTDKDDNGKDKPIRRVRLYDDIDGYELYSDLIKTWMSWYAVCDYMDVIAA
jgi:hypothetical protein